MNVLFLEYRLSDGEIVGYGTASRDTIPQGFAEAVEVIENGQPGTVDPAREKISTATGRRVAKSLSEQRAALRPDEVEVRAHIAIELAATDQFVVADRPLADGAREKWVAYRQVLRDLSKIGGVASMIAAWPARPDGADAINQLRSRI